MPSKKAKGDEEPVKPLSFYVKDRLELTKQLFSCLKSKQIKSRLPSNLQDKSIERIQQICLDEILGISSKRLLSIINNTKCPADTESDSDIEHISLSEISSDDEDDEIAFIGSDNNKKNTSDNQAAEGSKGKTTTKGPNEPKTMLELIELEARARAIRSQLALEPITKIELEDSDDEEMPEESPVTGPINPQPSTSKSSQNSGKSSESTKRTSEGSKKTKEIDSSDTAKKSKSSGSAAKSKDSTKKSESSKKSSEPAKTDPSKDIRARLSSPVNDKSKTSSRNERAKKSPTPPPSTAPTSRRVVVMKKSHHAELTITAPAPKPSAPPVKLKRNFSKTPSETSLSVTSKESETNIVKEGKNKSRSNSPDVITMEQNISTYFISDSDDDEPPGKKKSPEKSPQKSQEKAKESSGEVKSSEEVKSPKELKSSVEDKNEEQAGNEEIPKVAESPLNIEEKAQSPQESSNVGVEAESSQIEKLQSPKKAPERPASDNDDDNVVNLMSDTEMDFNASDKEDDESYKVTKEPTKEPSTSNKPQVEEAKEVSQKSDSDDDIVEILHSEDDLDTESSSKAPEDTETWNQRYMRSSTVKSVLKTTKLASKVRGKLAANKKTQKEKIQEKKNEEKEKEKEMNEKMSKLEEGSLEQFQVLKDSSSSSV